MHSAHVTVVVPVYNAVAYLEQCYASLLRQSFQDYVLVMVDDQSTDGSWEQLVRWSRTNNRLRVLRQKVHTGSPVGARNWAIRNARTPYLAFVDADDWLADASVLQEAYERMLATDSDLLYCAYRLFSDVQKQEIGQWTFPEHLHITSAQPCFHATQAHDSFWLNFNSGACLKVYKTAFLRRENIWFVPTHFEDLAFSWKTYSKASKIFALDSPAYVYRVHHRGQRSRGDTRTLAQCLSGLAGASELLDWHFAQADLRPLDAAFVYVMFAQVLRWVRDNLPPEDFPSFYPGLSAFMLTLRDRVRQSPLFSAQEGDLFSRICQADHLTHAYICDHFHLANAIPARPHA